MPRLDTCILYSYNIPPSLLFSVCPLYYVTAPVMLYNCELIILATVSTSSHTIKYLFFNPPPLSMATVALAFLGWTEGKKTDKPTHSNTSSDT